MTGHDSGDTTPSWMAHNDGLRTEMGLPPYEPPQFEDGTPTHEVVTRIERECDCTVRFVGVDTRYGDDLDVRLDGRPAFPVGRRRTETGNIVYQMTAAQFRERVRRELDNG